MIVSVPRRLKGLVAELSRHCLHVGWPTAWRLPSTLSSFHSHHHKSFFSSHIIILLLSLRRLIEPFHGALCLFPKG